MSNETTASSLPEGRTSKTTVNASPFHLEFARALAGVRKPSRLLPLDSDWSLRVATSVEFLQPDTEQIRHQIRGILDSYSHDWDILAELAQNSVDSIRRQPPTRGHVKIAINSKERSIEFSDNGSGIDPNKLQSLLRPFATDKAGMPNQIGQKGVGLTFILFSSSYFELETHHPGGSKRAIIHNASSWITSKKDEKLFVELDDVSPKSRGVKVKVNLSDKEHPLWDLSFSQVVFALRTRTALGNTDFIWADALNCDVEFTHVDKADAVEQAEFDCKYLLPTEGLKSEDSITVQDYRDWRSSTDRSDQDKRRKLQNKIVVREGKKYQAGRELRYWACFVPNRGVWQKLSEVMNLARGDGDNAENAHGDEVSTGYFFSGGLFTSSKGMPTGISIDMKPRGSAGYVPNFFILIEDPSLSFDIGRKAIQGRQQGMLREIAYESFRQYIREIVKYISGSIDDPDPDYDRDIAFEEIRDLPDLDSGISTFLKRPDGQEATVAGMFFEQLGKGRFSDFRPLLSGYKGRYDLYGRLGKRNCVLEFKFDLSGLFRDFSDERKMFDEIDIVVIWEVTEKDRNIISNRGLSISEINSGILGGSKRLFPEAHYKLNIDGVKSIEIVCMRKILKPDE